MARTTATIGIDPDARRYALAFGLVATTAAVGAARIDGPAIARAVLAWTAAAFGWLAIAYRVRRPRLLGKRAGGGRHPAAWVALGPVLAWNALILATHRRLDRRRAFDRVAPNLDLGRRLTPREAAGGPWVAVLDLAAELTEAGPFRRSGAVDYRSIPMLDALPPGRAGLIEAVDWLRGRTALGPVYLHCALGHGRSATVAAAYLVAIGRSPSVAEAVEAIRAARPGARPTPRQVAEAGRLASNQAPG